MTRVVIRALACAVLPALMAVFVAQCQTSVVSKDTANMNTFPISLGVQAMFSHSQEYCSPGDGGGVGGLLKLRVFRLENSGEVFCRFSAGFNPVAGNVMPVFTAVDFVAGIKPLDPLYFVFGIAKLRVNDTGDDYHCSESGASCSIAGIGVEYLHFFAEFDYYFYLDSENYDPRHADDASGRGSYSNTALGFRVGYYF